MSNTATLQMEVKHCASYSKFLFYVMFIFQTAVINMTYLAVDKMRKDKGGSGGSIINVSSTTGILISIFRFTL